MNINEKSLEVGSKLIKENLKNFSQGVFNDLKNQNEEVIKSIETNNQQQIDMHGDAVEQNTPKQNISIWVKILIKNLIVLLGFISIAMGIMTALSFKSEKFAAGILLAYSNF